MDGDNTLEQNTQATEATQTQDNAAETKYYTQEEFDRHMAGMRKAIESKFEKRFAELGDLDELRQLKVKAEQQRTEEAMKKGEFEKVLQEMAAKKDAEIHKRDSIIKEYKVNTPLLDAAARYKAVAPEQVKSLLINSVRLGDDGEVEVVSKDGSVRYSDSGTPLTVDQLVQEFLSANPHFVSAGPSNTNSRSNDGVKTIKGDFDVSKLDMSKAADRQRYREAKANGLI